MNTHLKHFDLLKKLQRHWLHHSKTRIASGRSVSLDKSISEIVKCMSYRFQWNTEF